MRPRGLYVHIPFCRRKCQYCDFSSYAGQEHLIPAYFEAVQREWNWSAARPEFTAWRPLTCYIGGGTPSLAIPELAAFLGTANVQPCLREVQEFTLEVNPGTVALPQLQALRDLGVTRLSIGMQSLHDTELRRLGRIHTRAEALACFAAARRAGFDNISVDLMFGIPGATLATWRATLATIRAYQPEHISMYHLTIEEHTPFWEQQQRGELDLPDEDTQAAMYEIGIALLVQAGYEHYEISNFARPKYRSQHNQMYWRNEAYLGFGAGAHSYWQGWRYWNTAALDRYLAQSQAVAKNIFSQADGLTTALSPVVAGAEHLDRAGMLGETMMLNLRLLEGIDLTAFAKRFGQSPEALYPQVIEKFCALQLLEIRRDHLRLTPRGLLLANEVLRDFLAD